MSWFEIHDGIHRVLDYPSGGFHGTWWLGIGAERSVTSRVVSLATIDAEELLTIRFQAEFADQDRRPLFNIERAVVFSRTGSSEFRMNLKRSNITQQEYDTLFHPFGFRPQVFLKACAKPLKTIAESRDARKRRWLRQFLQNEPASPEKAMLLESLNRK